MKVAKDNFDASEAQRLAQLYITAVQKKQADGKTLSKVEQGILDAVAKGEEGIQNAVKESAAKDVGTFVLGNTVWIILAVVIAAYFLLRK